MALWRRDQLRFALEEGHTQHPVVTVGIDTPVGRLMVMAEPVQIGRSMTLFGLHAHGDRTGANDIGAANLGVLARAFMEVMCLDELVVAGGLRTTGANPGRTPRAVRFSRRPAA